MGADVCLDETRPSWIDLKALVIRGAASDFMLDDVKRRRKAEGWRRALVHDSNDGLTINYNGDYPGGVTINKVAYISPKPVSSGGGPLAMRTVPELKIDGGVRFLWDHGPRVGGPSTEEVSLQDLIADLTARIEFLESA